VVCRLGTSIPIPGIDAAAFEVVFRDPGGFLCEFACGWKDTFDPLGPFAGGAVGAMAILTLTVMPFIFASIVVRLVKGMRASGGGG
jgi:preprotein translocase subunit SecY